MTNGKEVNDNKGPADSEVQYQESQQVPDLRKTSRLHEKI